MVLDWLSHLWDRTNVITISVPFVNKLMSLTAKDNDFKQVFRD